MENDCKFYDAELDCCILFSDWDEENLLLQPCLESCSKYKSKEKGGNEKC